MRAPLWRLNALLRGDAATASLLAPAQPEVSRAGIQHGFINMYWKLFSTLLRSLAALKVRADRLWGCAEAREWFVFKEIWRSGAIGCSRVACRKIMFLFIVSYF
jgi:hypothetical protein